jgi:hypothetical protein
MAALHARHVAVMVRIIAGASAVAGRIRMLLSLRVPCGVLRSNESKAGMRDLPDGDSAIPISTASVCYGSAGGPQQMSISVSRRKSARSTVMHAALLLRR